MRARIPMLVLLVAAVAGSGCATAEQWAEWRQHSSHFASGQHLLFSLRHQGKHPAPRVKQQDFQKANAESWWGDPVLVRPDQLFAG